MKIITIDRFSTSINPKAMLKCCAIWSKHTLVIVGHMDGLIDWQAYKSCRTNSCMDCSLYMHNYHISTGFWQHVFMSPCKSPFLKLALDIRNFMMGFVYRAGYACLLGVPDLIVCFYWSLCRLRFCTNILFTCVFALFWIFCPVFPFDLNST